LRRQLCTSLTSAFSFRRMQSASFGRSNSYAAGRVWPHMLFTNCNGLSP
jgi:hypothetical protein